MSYVIVSGASCRGFDLLRLFIVEYRSFNIGEKYELHNNMRFIANLGRAALPYRDLFTC